MIGRCEGKLRHETEAAAIKLAARTFGHTGQALDVYSCELCNGWHCGRSIYAKQRARNSAELRHKIAAAGRPA